MFRRYVLSLLLDVLLRKFEAYLLYLSLIWGKFPRRFSCHFSDMFSSFPARNRDMRNRFSALSSSLACIQKPGNWANNCKITYFTFLAWTFLSSWKAIRSLVAPREKKVLLPGFDPPFGWNCWLIGNHRGLNYFAERAITNSNSCCFPLEIS